MVLYSAECATKVALDGIQCLGEWPPPLTLLHLGCTLRLLMPQVLGGHGNVNGKTTRGHNLLLPSAVPQPDPTLLT